MQKSIGGKKDDRQEREITFPHSIWNGRWKQGYWSNRAIHQNKGPVNNNVVYNYFGGTIPSVCSIFSPGGGNETWERWRRNWFWGPIKRRSPLDSELSALCFLPQLIPVLTFSIYLLVWPLGVQFSVWLRWTRHLGLWPMWHSQSHHRNIRVLTWQ